MNFTVQSRAELIPKMKAYLLRRARENGPMTEEERLIGDALTHLTK